ncbi:hypothetical protein ASPBRDRAFT_319150 [Aspergillus brasiliensis CBS 101740]|uniref:Uncharacterized protein n=1 Tax=Aspergillus brasiliensis (strain CBS 101740 / IMI 381727 / IBT 21946) TaxID=767769 RepID=A0A1L9U900_ASPBC|nr:hypothetical protein ASPBRDRAFT_319150 [Aspergillus brasiliensis CBS 101740]
MRVLMQRKGKEKEAPPWEELAKVSDKKKSGRREERRKRRRKKRRKRRCKAATAMAMESQLINRSDHKTCFLTGNKLFPNESVFVFVLMIWGEEFILGVTRQTDSDGESSDLQGICGVGLATFDEGKTIGSGRLVLTRTFFCFAFFVFRTRGGDLAKQLNLV